MLSEDEFESWLETMEIVNDLKLMDKIKQSDDDIKKGRVFSEKEVDNLLDW